MAYWKRKLKERLLKIGSMIATIISLLSLLILLIQILCSGTSYLSWQFLTSYPSRIAEQAGIKSALAGSFYLLLITFIVAVPLGIATAIFLEEYAPKHRITNIININILNLAGMPSIVYGLLGLAIFAIFFGFDSSILTGGLTLALLILPIIVITSQEAIRAVPDSIKQAGYALGARRWQVVLGQILPAALPSIMTGVILSISRSIGETAPLIIIGALTYAGFVPMKLTDSFTALPIQIYNWAGRPQPSFHNLAASGIVVLLACLFVLNFVAVYIRRRFQKYMVK